jgi:hypothetical protein
VYVAKRHSTPDPARRIISVVGEEGQPPQRFRSGLMITARGKGAFKKYASIHFLTERLNAMLKVPIEVTVSNPPKASQITSLCLLPLNSLKQTFEISSSKAIKVVPLNDLNENCGTIHQRLGK